MKIEFDIFNREFFSTLTFSLKFQKKAQVSIIYMKNIVFLLPSCTSGTRSVICSKNIIRNFIPMVKMFWLSGTTDQAITYIRSVELNGNREHFKLNIFYCLNNDKMIRYKFFNLVLSSPYTYNIQYTI